jgi:transcriptional regulator with XRE-family HTH domain
MKRRDEIATALGAAMREVRQDRHESQVEVARRIGVDQTVLSKWELGRLLVALDDVERIEDALRLRPGGLLIRAGLVELAANRTEGALEADPFISIEDKRALLHFYLAAFKAAAAAQAPPNGTEEAAPRRGRGGHSRPASGR